MVGKRHDRVKQGMTVNWRVKKDRSGEHNGRGFSCRPADPQMQPVSMPGKAAGSTTR